MDIDHIQRIVEREIPAVKTFPADAVQQMLYLSALIGLLAVLLPLAVLSL